jgi:hypothetical protein
MGYADFLRQCRLIRVGPTRAQRDAAAILESAGAKFCVDYGLDNAIEKARELARAMNADRDER